MESWTLHKLSTLSTYSFYILTTLHNPIKALWRVWTLHNFFAYVIKCMSYLKKVFFCVPRLGGAWYATIHILCIEGIWKFSTHLHRLHQVSCLTPWIQWGKLHWTYETVFLLTFQYVIFGSTSYQCYTHTNDNNIIWLLRISLILMVILSWC